MERLDREALDISRITCTGMGFNLALTALKLVVGNLAGSLALMADGFNSLTDVVTDLAVLIGTRLGRRPADEGHPYGHGKLETFVAGIVTLGIIGVGIGVAWNAIRSLLGPAKPPLGLWVVMVAGLTMLVKEWLFHLTRRVAVMCRSAALRAKAWDHRSDVLVSFVVLIGGGGALVGWGRGDGIAGLLVSLVIIFSGGKIALEVLRELSEESAGAEISARVQELFSGIDEIRGWHKLRIRRVGRELLMDVHIVLDPRMTISQGHQIVERVEKAIQDGLEWPVNLVVHMDPDDDAIRSARIAAGNDTLKQKG